MDAIYEDIKKNVPDLRGISISEALEDLKKNPAGKPIKSEGGLLRALQRGNFALKLNGVWMYYEAIVRDPKSTSLHEYYQDHLTRWKASQPKVPMAK